MRASLSHKGRGKRERDLALPEAQRFVVLSPLQHENKLIPALKSALIFTAASLIEGVVDRGVG
jgi:hypothetical protein